MKPSLENGIVLRSFNSYDGDNFPEKANGKDNAGYDQQNNINENEEFEKANGVDKDVVSSPESEQEAIVLGSKEDPYRTYRWTKQICLVLVWICIGLYAEIIGPTLPDLMNNLGVDYEEISRALSGKSVGLMIGSICGGFAHEKFYKQTDLLIAIGLYLAALATILTPFSSSLAAQGTLFGLNGFAEGIINTGGNTMVMHLWGNQATSHMHSLHFGFGFGALLAPQIAKSFLGEYNDNETEVLSNIVNATMEPLKEARIEIPYAIIATFIFLFGFVVLGFYLKGLPAGFPVRKNTTRFRTMVSPGSCAGGNVIFGIQLFLCLWLYFIQTVGGERAFGKFLYSYARERTPQLSISQASNLQSLFWLSFTIGRFSGVLIAKFLSVQWIILGDIIGSLITSIVLSAFASDNDTVLFVFTAFMGLFVSVAFPNGMSWANLYLIMNSVGVMVLMVGGSSGGLIYQLMTGSLFESDPNNLMYVMVFYAIMMGVSFALMQGFAKWGAGSKNKSDQEDQKLSP